MTNLRGAIFMAALAVAPLCAVFPGYLMGSRYIIEASITAKSLFFAVWALILYRYVFWFFTSPLRHVPSPAEGSLLLGHGGITFREPPGFPILRWMKELPNSGLIGFWGFLWLNINLVPTTPESIMEVLSSDNWGYEKPSVTRNFFRRLIGNGLVVSEGHEHDVQRKKVNPAFSGKIVKELAPLFWEKSQMLCDVMIREAAGGKGTVDMTLLASRVTLDAIGRAAIGKEFGSLAEEQHELAALYESITDPRQRDMLWFLLLNAILPKWLTERLPMDANRRVEHASVNLRRISKDLLGEKRKEMEYDSSSSDQRDIVAAMIRLDCFNDDDLTDQLLTFLAAGHETIASALLWCLYALAKHPEVQTKLRTNCKEVLEGQDPRTVDMNADSIARMQYLDAFINEVLRLYPPIAGTTRLSLRDTHIAGQFVPKGTAVILWPYATQRMPSLWGDDADECRPERWLGADNRHGGASSPYAFLTFLHGRRSCIGESFARLELKCLIASVVLRLDLSLTDPAWTAIPDGMITVKPMGGLQLSVEELR